MFTNHSKACFQWNDNCMTPIISEKNLNTRSNTTEYWQDKLGEIMYGENFGYISDVFLSLEFIELVHLLNALY